MPDKKTLCDALRLLIKIADIEVTSAEIVTTGEEAKALMKSLEPAAKSLAPQLISHITEQARSIHVPDYQKLMDEINTAMNAAKFGDDRYIKVLERVRGYVHEKPNFRRLFLGGEQVSQDVFEAFEVAEDGDISEARDMLQQIHDTATCLKV